jgi:protocatechuate 3,4-dioxygenase beta subunit
MGFTNANLYNGGETTHFQILYDDTFSGTVGLQAAQQFMDVCEYDFDLMSGWFSNIGLMFRLPIIVEIANSSDYPAASWPGPFSPPAVTLNVGGTGVSFISADYVRYLVVCEVTEMFMASQGGTWYVSGVDEGSKGEGLSRFLGVQFVLANNLSVAELSDFQVLPAWLDSDRKNWVDNNSDINKAGPETGCTTCFIYYLHDQLGYSINEIISAGGSASTLADVYTNLTGTTGAWNSFFDLVQAHFPPGHGYSPAGDSLFPVPDLAGIRSGVGLLAGSSIDAGAGFGDGFITLTTQPKAEVYVTLISGFPTVLTVPDVVTVPVGAYGADVWVQAQPITGPLIHVPIFAKYADTQIIGSIAVEPQPSVISGLVTDGAMQPIADATLLFTAAAPITPETGDSMQLPTATDGTYLTPTVAPQLYQVTAMQSGYANAQAGVTVELGVPVTKLNFVLLPPEPFTVKGFVESQNGKLLQGVTVTLEPTGLQATTTDAHGVFVLTGMPDGYTGDYQLTATLPGYQPHTVTFTIPNGATITEILVLFQLGTLTGSVTRAAGGAPIVGATITAGPVSATSAADGTYTLVGLDPGDTSITAAAAGYDPAHAQAWITPGGHTTRNITMTPASAAVYGTVTGTPAGTQDLPLANATVAVAGVGVAHTDHTGSYTITPVPTGTHQVTATAARCRPATVSIQVFPQQAVREDFDLFPLHEPRPVGDLPNN